jgi:formate dehydrogenase major subunit
MNINRRNFLKITGTSAAGAAILGLGLNLNSIKSHAQSLKINHCKETTSICCYCAVGCGVICSTGQAGAGKIINIEGDPDHPVNEGALCAKGAGLSQLANNDNRITTPMYRAPHSDKWRNVSWKWALTNIAERVKKSRDTSFEHRNGKGQVVNRTMGIASVGSAALDNEECWIYQALMRTLGVVYIEHQARI